jgi:hypothetical protein
MQRKDTESEKGVIEAPIADYQGNISKMLIAHAGHQKVVQDCSGDDHVSQMKLKVTDVSLSLDDDGEGESTKQIVLELAEAKERVADLESD